MLSHVDDSLLQGLPEHDSTRTGVQLCLDSGADYHVVNDITLFSSYRKVAAREFDTVNGTVTATIVGIILLLLWNLISKEFVIVRINATLIDSAPRNLISVSALEDDGYYSDFISRILTNREGDIRISFKRVCGMYIINADLILQDNNNDAALMHVSKRHRHNARPIESVPRVSNAVYADLNNKFGPITHHLYHRNLVFTTENVNVRVATGEQSWTDGTYFGILQTQQHELILSTVQHILSDFAIKALTSRYILIVPHYTDTVWWNQYTRYFSIPVIYPKGVELFTDETSGTAVITDTEYCVLYKDAAVTTKVDETVLAHLRYGHYSSKKLESIVKQNFNTGLNIETAVTGDHDFDCQICRKFKMKRPHHGPSERVDSTKVGLVVFIDFLVLNIESKEGYKYVLGFIDDHSRYTRLYFVRTRDEALRCLKRYHAWIITFRDMAGQPYSISVVQTDNAGELTSGEWNHYCSLHHIHHRVTSPYLHENASIIERYWSTLLSMTKSMLHGANLDVELWPLAMRHANYIYVRLPHMHFNDECSPFEMFHLMKPDLSSIRVFGSVAYAFIDKNLRPTKLDATAGKYIYVGHEESSKSYLLLNTETYKIHRSGMVKVIEALDSLGALMSNPELTIKHDLLGDITMDDLPTPIMAIESFNDANVCHAILHHSAYYDAEDRETYGIIKIQTTEQPDGVWLHLSEFLRCNYEHIKMLKEYLQPVVSNRFYPIFNIAKITYKGQREDAFIVSTDPGTQYPYQVVFDQPSCGIMDVKKSAVHFGDHIAMNITESIIDQQRKTEAERLINYKNPKSYLEAMKLPDAAEWEKSTFNEFKQMKDLQVLQPMREIPEGVKPIGSKLVFKLKLFDIEDYPTIDKYKSRLVGLGYEERYGIDYMEAFSASPQISSMRFVLCTILQYNLSKRTIDVKGAFLRSTLKVPIYIRLPKGFKFEDCDYALVLKNLYGFKQAARDWFDLLKATILSFDGRIRNSVAEPCIYFIFTTDLIFLVLVQVDDFIIGCNNDQYLESFVSFIQSKFEITDNGIPTQFNGMKIEWKENSVEISQGRYIRDLVSKYNLTNCKRRYRTPMEHKFTPVKGNKDNLPDFPYGNLIGELSWVARISRPDIMDAVNILQRYTHCYSSQLWDALIRVLLFLMYTSHWKLTFVRSIGTFKPITIYVDSDWAGDKEKALSTSGAIVLYYGNAISWICEKQKTQAHSSCEAEYVALGAAGKEGMFFVHFLKELGMDLNLLPIDIYIDNKGAAQIAENRVNNRRTRHIDIRHHYIRDLIEDRVYNLEYIAGDSNLADIFTKPLGTAQFTKYARRILNLPDDIVLYEKES